MKSVLFIINPFSGRGRARNVVSYIEKYLDKALYSYSLSYTEYSGHATELSRNTDVDIVVAVGGDGTVNEVINGLIGTDKVLGIIPCGSGNGLAFHHKIPYSFKGAINVLNYGHTQNLDCCSMNSHMFCCTCGVGLDAEVSKLFAKNTRRGFISYVSSTVSLMLKYKPQCYKLVVDGEQLMTNAALITIGNANQWGNNAFITPLALSNDSKLDVTIIEKITILNAMPLAIRLFAGNIDRSHSVRTVRGREVCIFRDKNAPAHFDGELCEDAGKMITASVFGKISIICCNGYE